MGSPLKSGIMPSEGKVHLGRPLTGIKDENITKTKRENKEDQRKTIDKISEEMNGSWSTFMTMHEPTLF
ncbi:hypothetical protein TNCV_473881 [Trichonephila clavipes]|nr:hypothetical protein TNCV_473881 [Trichonephila clavipes]